MVGDGERWKQGDLTDLAMVSDGQRWWAMIQVVLQLFQTGPTILGGIRTGWGPKRAASTETEWPGPTNPRKLADSR